MSNWLQNRKLSSRITLSILKSIEPLSRNGEPNMTQNEHVYAICCRPDVDDNDVISYENVKTL